MTFDILDWSSWLLLVSWLQSATITTDGDLACKYTEAKAIEGIF